jgi:ABC-2 type transport system ATP-binding protein
MSRMSESAIQLDELTRDFNGVRAVDHVTMQVATGSIFGFLGPNGAGKTTTIRLLLGLLEPTAGNARVLGFDVRRQSHRIREHVGVLLEHDGLYVRLTGWDNINFFGQVYRLAAQEYRSRGEELLKRLGIWEHRNQRVNEYSRGMRQKLAIVRALLHRPRLIFLDEPSVGLDPESALALREDIQTLARNEGVTAFLTTHNLAEAEKICDTVGVIRKGKLVACDSPSQLRQMASRPQVEILANGLTPALLEAVRALPHVAGATLGDGRLQVDLTEMQAAPIVKLLVEKGVGVEEVRRVGVSLEQAFMVLMHQEEPD